MSRTHEVVIVGGGVFGCAVAYELARRSLDVLLIDKSLPGRATSASAGGLWPVGEAVGLGCGVIFHAAQAGNGNGKTASVGPQALPEVFRDFLVAGNDRFPALSEELRELGGVDIEYAVGPGLLFAFYDEYQRAIVEQVETGLPPQMDLVHLSPRELRELEPNLSRDCLGGALLEGEHQVNPMQLAEAYKRAAIRLGAEFRPDCSVQALRRQGDRVVGVETDGGFVPAGTVVNAAGSWAARLAQSIGLTIPVFPVRGQIVLTEALPKIMRVCLSTSKCYLAQKQHGEVLIGSTTEHAGFDVSVTHEAIERLCRGAVQAIPLLRHVRVKRVWAGLRPGTPDELPILGPMGSLQGYLNATGGFRTGIVASPIVGQVVAQSICGEDLFYPLGPFLADRFCTYEALQSMFVDSCVEARLPR
jgi:hydrogen cyanide synthase HcnC